MEDLYRVLGSNNYIEESLNYIYNLGATPFIFKDNDYFSLFFFYQNYFWEVNLSQKRVWYVAIGKFSAAFKNIRDGIIKSFDENGVPLDALVYRSIYNNAQIIKASLKKEIPYDFLVDLINKSGGDQENIDFLKEILEQEYKKGK